MAKIIDGSKVAREKREKLKEKISSLKEEGRAPALNTIIIGNDPGAKAYVQMKEKVAKKVGVESEVHYLSEDTSQQELLNLIEKLNNDQSIDGILVQLPLPDHIDETIVMETIRPDKDVDGFHPLNKGYIFSNTEKDIRLDPCTPKAVMELIHQTDIEIKGKKAVMVGHSSIVGKPVTHLLLDEFATVTVCHVYTEDLAAETKKADIVISAAGVAGLIKADMVKEGAVVIDVGINKVDGEIVGDVEYEKVKDKASYITPVPGGVGPVTIATLMENTVKAREYHGL